MPAFHSARQRAGQKSVSKSVVAFGVFIVVIGALVGFGEAFLSPNKYGETDVPAPDGAAAPRNVSSCKPPPDGPLAKTLSPKIFMDAGIVISVKAGHHLKALSEIVSKPSGNVIGPKIVQNSNAE